jgi:spermidine synthase
MVQKKSARLRQPEHGFVVEYNNATGGVSFWEKDDNHSVADKNGVSTADYIHAIYGFLRQAKSKHVLMIGCGGGTLATMLRRAKVKVTIADIDARNYDIARTYFNMPDDVECHVADGEAFLKADERQFDAIVLDAYADNDIPRHFKKQRFFNLMKARLKPRGGFVLVNLIISSLTDKSGDRFMRLMNRSFPSVRLLDVADYESRNAIGLAGSVKTLKKPRLLMRPARGAKALAKEIAEMDFRTIKS